MTNDLDSDAMVTVRQIRPDEGAELRAIRLRALTDSPSAFGSTVEETLARPMSYWAERSRGETGTHGSTLFIAEDDGEWVGLIGGFIVDADGGRSADLISMWVDPRYRGQGIGGQLVERLLDWARGRGAGSVTLWVTENNDPAISLYLRCGFNATGNTQPLPSNPSLSELEMVRSP